METTFTPVISPDQQVELAKLADEIWHEYWPALIGIDQTDYMVDNFQSIEAIKRDMTENNYEYWFIEAQDEEGKRIVGYTGGHDEPGDEQVLHLENLPARRGTRTRIRLAHDSVLRRPLPLARLPRDVPHRKQGQRPGHSRVQGKRLRDDRRRRDRHRRGLRHGRLHHGKARGTLTRETRRRKRPDLATRSGRRAYEPTSGPAGRERIPQETGCLDERELALDGRGDALCVETELGKKQIDLALRDEIVVDSQDE